MSQALPMTTQVDAPERESRVLRIADDDDTGETFETLSSATARAILAALYDDPAPSSVVADRVDCSLQNVAYHLKRLRRVDLVEVVDTWYSAKGVEMDVYAPTSDPLVIAVGDDETAVLAAASEH